MSEAEKPDVLAKVRAALQSGGSRISPLSRWFLDNHDAFAALVEGERPNWDVLAETFRDAGILDSKGNSPDGERLRVTWWRVQRQYAKRKAKKAGKAGKAADAPAPSSGTRAEDGGLSPQDALARMRAEMNRRSGR